MQLTDNLRRRSPDLRVRDHGSLKSISKKNRCPLAINHCWPLPLRHVGMPAELVGVMLDRRWKAQQNRGDRNIAVRTKPAVNSKMCKINQCRIAGLIADVDIAVRGSRMHRENVFVSCGSRSSRHAGGSSKSRQTNGVIWRRYMVTFSGGKSRQTISSSRWQQPVCGISNERRGRRYRRLHR